MLKNNCWPDAIYCKWTREILECHNHLVKNPRCIVLSFDSKRMLFYFYHNYTEKYYIDYQNYFPIYYDDLN